jgi:hypothetical protein
VRDCGHEVTVVDYEPWHCNRYRGARLSKRWIRNWKPNAQAGWKLLVFSYYVNKYLPVGSRRYTSLEQLRQNPPIIDVCICGSDQIWNASRTNGFDPCYFASFGGRELKRVAYAASFGQAELGLEYYKALGDLLRPMDLISVRERSGEPIVAAACGKSVPTVLDPTMLISDYDRMIRPPSVKGRYVFAYSVQPNPEFVAAARSVGDRLGVPVYYAGWQSEEVKRSSRFANPTPGQWLGWIKYADAVLTSSFHGTVFSILFRRPFLALGLRGAIAGRSARVTELLHDLGLSRRFVREGDTFDYSLSVTTPIDWQGVKARYETALGVSVEFLRNALCA